MRVPADIVTGFLGSGKTTLLRHVLESGLGGQRVAVVVNDLADVGIDGRVIEAGNLGNFETLVELDNGCICCSIDLRFEYAIQDLVDTVRPDLVLIESTGVADPRLLIDKLSQTMLTLDAVITVVDAVNIERALRESEAAHGQIGAADFLVVNKTDLVSAEAIEALERQLSQYNPRALRARTAFGKVETPILFGTSVRAYRERAGADAHGSTDGIESFTCSLRDPLLRTRFEEFLDHLPLEVYRAKGIVQFAEESAPSLFNLTCGRASTEWLPARAVMAEGSQGVFIGKGVSRHRERITAGFLSCSVAV